MKKRILSIVLFSIFLIGSLQLPALGAQLGDIDIDGDINAADARLVLRAAVGLEEFSDEAFAAADIDGDGQLTASDARSVLRTAVGLENLYGVTVPADFKAGFIFLHDAYAGYDNNIITAARTACAQLGLKSEQYIIKTNVPESYECYEAALDLIEQGCKVIFADAFGHEPYLMQAAKEHPDVRFCQFTGTGAHTAGLANYTNAYAAIYEGRYLSGIAAGMKLNQLIEAGTITADEAKLGFVGAFPYAEVISSFTAFYLGARSVCPTATMQVIHTYSWYDPAEEYAAAQTLIEGGCKVISQFSDSDGAPNACAEAGVMDIAYNTTATKGSCILTSLRINWIPCFVDVMLKMITGENIPADRTGSLADGSVIMNGISDLYAAPGTAVAVAKARSALLRGEIHVFDTSAFTVNGEHLRTYLANVDDDEQFTPETEAISDGYFHECEYRSAPYFDIIIDGITGGGWAF